MERLLRYMELHPFEQDYRGKFIWVRPDRLRIMDGNSQRTRPPHRTIQRPFGFRMTGSAVTP